MNPTPRTWTSSRPTANTRPGPRPDESLPLIQNILAHAIVILTLTLIIFSAVTALIYDQLPPEDPNMIMTVMFSLVAVIITALLGLDILTLGLRLLVQRLRRH